MEHNVEYALFETDHYLISVKIKIKEITQLEINNPTMPIILKHINPIKPKQFLYEAPPKWLLEIPKEVINFKDIMDSKNNTWKSPMKKIEQAYDGYDLKKAFQLSNQATNLKFSKPIIKDLSNKENLIYIKD